MVDSQFIGIEEHDGEGALMGASAIVTVLAFVGSILLHGGNWTGFKQAGRQNALVTDDSRPGRITAKAGKIGLAWLSVQVGDATLRLLATQFLSGTSGGAAILGGLLR